MSSPDAARIAQVLAKVQGNSTIPYEEGLQSPPEQQILENLAKVAQGYGAGSLGGGIATALAQHGAPALQAMGEAGAIFPEGEVPNITSMDMKREAEAVIPPTQQTYLQNLKNYAWHAQNQDWPRVLNDKWAMLKNAGGY